MGAMLPWEYGGMNLPETIYQLMIDMVSRAEAGLMTVFGLLEIALAINEYADQELKDRLLPKFARGEVTGAMVSNRTRRRLRPWNRANQGNL